MPVKPKRRKPKIRSRNKAYPFQDSPLYKLRSKGRLCHILDVDAELLRDLKGDHHYRRFTSEEGRKPREIHEPDIHLDKVHSRLASLLVRIAPPDYLHSGIKGRSNISNARAHLGNTNVITCDLKAFFDSTTRAQIFDFFLNTLQCSSDVADLLSRVSCVDDHCPTGSRLSMPIAFFANFRMFSALAHLATDQGLKMTLYVDDLTFSGNKASKKFVTAIERVVKKYGHSLKKGKTKVYKMGAPKSITGAIVEGNTLKPRNAHLRALRDDFTRWKNGESVGPIDPKLDARVLGRLNSLAEIEPAFKARARSFSAEVSRKKSEQG